MSTKIFSLNINIKNLSFTLYSKLFMRHATQLKPLPYFNRLRIKNDCLYIKERNIIKPRPPGRGGGVSRRRGHLLKNGRPMVAPTAK